MTKIDISSTAIEKGIDLATKFVDKLIIPPIEETGLLIRDKVTFWKFKNQVKMLNKAKMYCEQNNVNPKTISLKVLCPLLDYSALEETEELQDKWAILLCNMVDSEQNIENHVFPYILSQVSLNEFSFLENVYQDKVDRQERLTQELNELKANAPEIINKINADIQNIETEISNLKKIDDNTLERNRDKWKLERDKTNLKQEIKSIERKELSLMVKINEPESIPEDELKDFELSNLSRLGLIKYVQNFYANSQTLEIPYEHEERYLGYTSYANVDLDVDIESEESYILTQLGELFIQACKVKK